MREAVELLMSKAKAIRTSSEDQYERDRSDLKDKLQESIEKSKGLVLSAQEICDHDSVRREESFEDMHKGEEWTTEYCGLCDKRLRRY